MIRTLAMAMLLYFSYSAKASAEVPLYDYDKSHTSILFFINHAGFSKMVGEFNDYGGYFLFDSANPEESFVTITIDPKSIDTGHDGLNKKLQNEDYFNSSMYNSIKFESTKIKKTGSNTGEVTGNLTLLGVTKPLVFDVIFNKEASFMGKTKAGFSLKSSLKRSDFGMSHLIPDVGDDVDIMIEVEGVRRDLK